MFDLREDIEQIVQAAVCDYAANNTRSWKEVTREYTAKILALPALKPCLSPPAGGGGGDEIFAVRTDDNCVVVSGRDALANAIKDNMWSGDDPPEDVLAMMQVARDPAHNMWERGTLHWTFEDGWLSVWSLPTQAADAMESLVMFAWCPDCDGQGWYVGQNFHTGDAEQVQCQRCNCTGRPALSAAPKAATIEEPSGEDAVEKDGLILTPHEKQSGHTRMKWAAGLIAQLPKDHDGRNSWLMNWAEGDEADALRAKYISGLRHSHPVEFEKDRLSAAPKAHDAATIEACAKIADSYAARLRNEADMVTGVSAGQLATGATCAKNIAAAIRNLSRPASETKGDEG